MIADIYNIIGNTEAIAWTSERNGWRVFDIRLPAPITEPNEGTLVTSWMLTVIACPI